MRPRRRWRAALAALVLGLVLLATTAGPAAAHASLVSSDPPDGARLDEAPDEVSLEFNEPVSADLGGVRVFAADGRQVQEGAAETDGTTVSVGLEEGLGEGTYVISYRVISADGHPIRGATIFGVGPAPIDEDAAAALVDDDQDRPWEVAGAIARALAYAGTLLAAGGVLFLLVVRPGADERPRNDRIVGIAAVVGALGAVAALPVQAALGTGQGPGSLLDDGVLANVAADGLGLSVAMTVGGLAVLLLVRRRSLPLAVATGAVAVLGFAASGHTRAGDHPALTTLADAVHLGAAAVWGGGLALLWATLRARRAAGADTAATVQIVGRFSSLATAAVLVVGVTGLLLGWSEVRTLDGLTSTTYGKVLLAKALVVGVIAGFGAYNHLRLVPALTAGKTKAAMARLAHVVRLEVLLLLAVVALTSVLVVVTPSRSLAEGGVVEAFAELGEAGSVQVTVDPATTGSNEVHLYLYDPQGRPADLAETVAVDFTLPAADLGPIEREAVRAGPAHFQVIGEELAVEGDWTLTIRARLDEFTEATGTVTIPIQP